MKLKIHLPRKIEAELDPPLDSDLIISPRFYKKSGWVPVFYFTTIDAKGNEEKYIMTMSASTKYIRVERLSEVIPVCDEGFRKDKKPYKSQTQEPGTTEAVDAPPLEILDNPPDVVETT